jgi:hypothetical protein
MAFMLLVLPAGILAIANRLCCAPRPCSPERGFALRRRPFLRLMALIGR